MIKLGIKKESPFSNRNNFLFIAFYNDCLHNFIPFIDIYQFRVLYIIYGILNPSNKNEV